MNGAKGSGSTLGRSLLSAVIGLVVLIALISAIKVTQIRAMIAQGESNVPPPETVTTAAVRATAWEGALTAVGSVAAVNGVIVSAELPGKVVAIPFEAGGTVKKGDLLLRQDTSSEEAQLPGAVAQAQQTRANLARDAKMLEERLISRAAYESSLAAYKLAKAQADNLRATIAKKTIRAPFDGRLGIRQVNLGQLLLEGDAIVPLQSLDPVFVNFTLPQQDIGLVGDGFPVRVTCDCRTGLEIEGRVTAIDPLVDADTRNVRLQATLANPDDVLRPGMFVNVAVTLPTKRQVLVIPVTAVLYAPYGDSVFVVEARTDKTTVVRQQFVRLGEKRGDFVAVTEGLKAGEQVVTTGVFKLRNGQPVAVDNRLAPPFREAPTPANES